MPRNSQVTGPNGEPVTIDASVDVDRSIPIGSLIWRGKLSVWNSGGQKGLMEVMSSSEADDLRGEFTKYQVQVKFYSDTFPTPDG